MVHGLNRRMYKNVHEKKFVNSESVQELGTDSIRKKYAIKVLKKSVFL